MDDKEVLDGIFPFKIHLKIKSNADDSRLDVSGSVSVREIKTEIKEYEYEITNLDCLNQIKNKELEFYCSDKNIEISIE